MHLWKSSQELSFYPIPMQTCFQIIQIQSAAWYVKFVDFMFGTFKARKKEILEPEKSEKLTMPQFEIVKTAQDNNFDLIIMETHGHGEFEEMVLGSTASGVILKSKVPVLVARPS